MKRPEYVLRKPVQIKSNRTGEYLTLQAGSHVQPINYDYIPKHLKDLHWVYFDKEIHVFCATKYGIYPLQRSDIREAY